MARKGSGVLDLVIETVVGLIAIGYLGPVGLLALANATGFTAGGVLATIFTTVLPILGAIVFLYIMYGYIRARI